MKVDKNYKIDIYGLKNGSHEYEFEFDQSLFENFENRLIDAGSGRCAVTLLKKDTLIELDFSITGTLELTCDRSMELFDHPIQLSEVLILKYGDVFDDSRDDFWIIPNTEQSINISHVLYEYLTLAVPMKKLHPKFQDEEDDQMELVYSSEDHIDESDNEENEVDPRWNALKNIKKLK